MTESLAIMGDRWRTAGQSGYRGSGLRDTAKGVSIRGYRLRASGVGAGAIPSRGTRRVMCCGEPAMAADCANSSEQTGARRSQLLVFCQGVSRSVWGSQLQLPFVAPISVAQPARACWAMAVAMRRQSYKAMW